MQLKYPTDFINFVFPDGMGEGGVQLACNKISAAQDEKNEIICYYSLLHLPEVSAVKYVWREEKQMFLF